MPTPVASYNVNSTAANTTALTTPSFTPTTGEIVVFKGVSEGVAGTYGAPTATGGGITWTKRVEATLANNVYAVIWTGTVTAGGSAITISSTVLSSSLWHSMTVERYTSAQLAATPATNKTQSTGAPNGSITTVAANSIVSWLNGDWAAVSPATRAYRSSAIQDGLHDVSTTRYVAYYATQAAASAGAQTYGLSAPLGQTYTLLAIEIQDAGGGSSFPVSGTVAAVSDSSGAVTAKLAASGTCAAVSAVSLAVAALLGVTGTAAAVSGTSASVGLLAPVSGAAAAVSAASGAVTSLSSVSGTVAAVSGSSGDVSVISGGALAVSGTVAAVSGSSGQVTALRPVTGTTAAVSAVSGDVTALRPISGQLDATSGSSGAVTVISGDALAVSGTTQVVSGASGAVSLRAAVSGTADAVAASSGAVQSIRTVSGTVVVLSGASGSVTSSADLVRDITVFVTGPTRNILDVALTGHPLEVTDPSRNPLTVTGGTR